MANKYFYARRRTDGRWEFVCRGAGAEFAVGYCPFHDGHPTEREAQACYRQWILDHKLFLDGRSEGCFCPCVICGELTDRHAQVSFWTRSLCDRHRNRARVEQIYPEILLVITA